MEKKMRKGDVDKKRCGSVLTSAERESAADQEHLRFDAPRPPRLTEAQGHL